MTDERMSPDVRLTDTERLMIRNSALAMLHDVGASGKAAFATALSAEGVASGHGGASGGAGL